MVSYLLSLRGKVEEDEEKPEINTSDSLWGETGTMFCYEHNWFFITKKPQNINTV